MEIDFSKVVLFVLAVLPGYLALRARKSVAPRSMHKKGATEELAEFLVYSTLAHVLVATLLACLGVVAGILWKHRAFFYLSPIVGSPLPDFGHRLLTLPLWFLLIYVPLSFACGWSVGFFRGLMTVWHPLRILANRFGMGPDSRVAKWWLRWIGRFLLNSRPVIYDVLFPDANSQGVSNLVFVEVELKDDKGMLAGQVKAFSILPDEEEHKLLYLIDVFRRAATDTEYESLNVDGVLLDLSEVQTLRVRQSED